MSERESLADRLADILSTVEPAAYTAIGFENEEIAQAVAALRLADAVGKTTIELPHDVYAALWDYVTAKQKREGGSSDLPKSQGR